MHQTRQATNVARQQHSCSLTNTDQSSNPGGRARRRSKRASLGAWLAVLLAFALIAASCGSDRTDSVAGTSDDGSASTDTGSGDDTAASSDSDSGSDDGGTDGTVASDTTGDATDDGGTDGDDAGADTGEPEPEPEPEAPLYGDTPWPCGPGDASGATQQGVTDDKIVIGVGDDRGFAAVPDLNRAQTEALLAHIEVCNSVGGINGRQIEPVVYEAAIFSVQAKMTEACDTVFMLVGEGWSEDGSAEQTRLNCDLAAVPAWSVSAAFAHGPNMLQPLPNPADQQAMSQPEQLKALITESQVANSATMFGSYPATEQSARKVAVAWETAGYTFVDEISYNINGEEDWTPFVLNLKDQGIEHVFFSGSCLPNYQLLRQTALNNDYDGVWTADSNFYEAQCIAENGDGAMDNTFVRLAFIPFEEADVNVATADFLEIVNGAGQDPTLLGMQSVSAFLLWATAVKACGSELTSECVLSEIRSISDWTGHGLHVPSNPSSNVMPECGILVEMVGTEYVRVAPAERGTYECGFASPTITTDAVEAAQLDENRVSQQFTGE